MNSNWSNSGGWVLMIAAVLLLAILRRLDLLLIVAPLSTVFGYRRARIQSRGQAADARVGQR